MFPWKLYLYAGIFVAGSLLYLRLDYLAKENKKLSTALKSANERIVTLDKLLAVQRAIVEDERNLIDEIDKDKPENDGDTAPVLLNALRRLQREPAK